MLNFADEMLRLPKTLHHLIYKTLSVRLSLIVVLSMTAVLLASLAVMMLYSRKALKEEALQKASQTLTGTVQQVDNILLSAEQTAGNFYFHLLPRMDSREDMLRLSRQVVESNPFVAGCALAFKPGLYEEGENFIAYYRRTSDSTSVRSDSFTDSPYTAQAWYNVPMESGRPGWMKPLSRHYDASGTQDSVWRDESVAMITFCLPLCKAVGSKPVGVMGVDVSLQLLSQIVLAGKPSENSYCALLDENGSFIVHPDTGKLFHQSVFTQSWHGADPSVAAAAKEMISGHTGYRPFRMNGADYYVFYTPFERAHLKVRTADSERWSMGIIYPKDDIFGGYNSLLYYVLAIAILGLLVLFLLSRLIIHRQLQPLIMLSHSAQHIADGHYDEQIPDSHQEDEIGRLQDNFQHMQQSLAAHIDELEHLKATLKERGEGLQAAYERAQKADRMKMTFLHNMTNQMIGPAEAIDQDVDVLMHCSDAVSASVGLAGDIQQNGKTIAELLDNLIKISDEEKIKEGGDD